MSAWRIVKRKDKHEYLHIEGKNKFGNPCPIADICITSGAKKYARIIKAAPELWEARKRKRKVVIEVLGGVADVTRCPEDVEVEIIDYDNEEE